MTPDPVGPGGRSLLGSTLLSWSVALLLLAALAWAGGVWNLLANTRLLDLLIEGGVVRYHDGHLGVVDGIDSQQTYLAAKDLIDYRLLLLAVGVYLTYWIVSGVRFHAVCRFLGVEQGPGAHVRAFLYGSGLGQVVPFRFGEVATVSAMEAEGVPGETVRRSFTMTETLTLVFQIGVFWLFGLAVTEFDTWISQMIWGAVIVVATYLVARGTGVLRRPAGGYWRSHGATLRALGERPGALARLGSLSVFVMLLDDVTPFLLAMAFTGDVVILNVPFFVIQAGVVAGYVARRIPITPHGIGQWEWAFAMALVYSGVGMPEAVTIALLDSFVRFGTGLLCWTVVVLRRGVGTTFQAVRARYLAPASVSDTAPTPPDGGVPNLAGAA